MFPPETRPLTYVVCINDITITDLETSFKSSKLESTA